MLELVDKTDSKSVVSNGVWVRVPPSLPEVNYFSKKKISRKKFSELLSRNFNCKYRLKKFVSFWRGVFCKVKYLNRNRLLILIKTFWDEVSHYFILKWNSHVVKMNLSSETKLDDGTTGETPTHTPFWNGFWIRHV